jgi:ELWxxDGT repeat protein
MKQILLFITAALSLLSDSYGQVVPLVSNKHLEPLFTVSNKAIMLEAGYNRIWIHNAGNGSTFQLPDSINYDGAGAILNGQVIFAGITPSTGSELWMTDGTIEGTKLLKDIYPGKEGSFPFDDFALLNGYLYFTAVSSGIGRELWRTNGTAEGTTLVKDIMPGPAQSALKGKYHIFSTGSYLLMNVVTYTEGYELWKSDGTAEGTYLLKDINPGKESSSPSAFTVYQNMVLFSATDKEHGTEIWKTDGTGAGTTLVKDIRPGGLSSFYYLSLHEFNGRFLFIADDGTAGEEIWTTDGTDKGTFLLKDINTISERSHVSLANSVKMNGKLIFFAYQEQVGSELWETDGTFEGTKMFREILPGLDSGIPLLMSNENSDGTSQPFFQGNQFFFLFGLPKGGVELWKSDGTANGTAKIKTIKTTDNVIENVSYVYTSNAVYFSADDGIYGSELWKTDGTAAGTKIVADINAGTAGSDILFFPVFTNNKLLFRATNGDNEYMPDLYMLDLALVTLPMKLEAFTAKLEGDGARLNWTTLEEINTKEFVVERSEDGIHFMKIGTLAAKGQQAGRTDYSFFDEGIATQAKQTLYYRLELKDLDGKTTITPWVSVKLNRQAEWSVQLVGNPVRDQIRIQTKGINQQFRLTIADISGRVVTTNPSTVSDNISMPANALSPGTYFLIAERQGKREVIKFIKL